VRLEPDKPDWRIERAYAGQNLGVLLLEGGQAAEALRAFEQTREAWQGVVSQRPAMNIDLGNTLGWIAKAREARHDYAGAIAAQEAKREAVARLQDAASDRRVQYHLAISTYEVSGLQLSLGRPDAAAASASEAIERFELLVRADAANLDWLAQLASARLSLAEARLAQGAWAAAREQLVPLRAIVARLIATPDRKVRWQVKQRGRLVALQARLAASEGHAAAHTAMAELAAYLEEIQQRQAGGKPLEPELAPVVAAAGLAMGDALQRTGQAQAAAAHWAAATERLQAGGRRAEAPAMALLGLLALRSGNAQEARAWAEKVEPTTYRHPDAAELRRWAAQAAKPAR
jgi:hypothetical protein